MAGPMLAMVAAEMSMIPSAPRRSRCSCPATATIGLLLSAKGTDSELVISLPPSRDVVPEARQQAARLVVPQARKSGVGGGASLPGRSTQRRGVRPGGCGGGLHHDQADRNVTHRDERHKNANSNCDLGGLPVSRPGQDTMSLARKCRNAQANRITA